MRMQIEQLLDENRDHECDGYGDTDVLTGDQTLFVRADMVETAWRLFTPVLERPRRVHAYAAGTWGPVEADRLPERAGHHWFAPPDGR